MEPGMTFTIEPILLLEKTKHYITWKDNWSGIALLNHNHHALVLTDGIPSAQWEHTIEITESGYKILTKRQGETEDAIN